MLLALLRHAPAHPPSGPEPASDALRALTPRGRRRMRRVGRGLARAGLRFDRLLTSPLRRATETAALARHLVDGPVQVEPLLAQAPTPALLERLGSQQPLLVGHEPHLSALAAWLACGDPALGAGLRLRKAGLLLLEGAPQPGAMRIVALLPPSLSRHL